MSSIGGKSRDSTDFSRSSKPAQSSNGKEICESEELCNETEGFRILDEFKKLYENRIDAIDQNSSVPEFERISTKLKIMTEWVKDLREQNVMLVRTVGDLEQAAVSRVKLLEDKLLHSSNLVSENILQCTNSGEALNTLSDRVCKLEKDKDYLEQRIENLQSDIRGLLELIRRAREENCWSHDGIQFYEITPGDIPAPLDCTCDQEKADAQDLQYKHNLKNLQDKEGKLLARLAELEEHVSKQNKIISNKDEDIKKCISQVRNLRDNHKERSSFANHIIGDYNDLEFEIMQMAESLESTFVAKDLEVEALHQNLQELNTKLDKLLHEDKQNKNQIQELESQLATLQKEFLESREVLTSELAEKHDQVMSLRTELQLLEEECRHINMHAQYKEDVIKKLREERIQTKEQGDNEKFSPHQDKILIYLMNTKKLMEKEKETLSSLKEEIKKELHYKKKQDFRHQIPVIYKTLEDIKSLLKNHRIEVMNHAKEESEVCSKDSCNEANHESVIATFLQQFKRMEEFRMCTVEAQAATEDLREKMQTAICNFNWSQEKYCGLNKLVAEVVNYLISTKEKISDAINQLKLQEEVRSRHKERTSKSRDKLKDMKDEMNHARSQFSRCVSSMQESNQQLASIGFTEIYTSNDVLNMVVDEVDQVVSNVNVFQSQENFSVSLLSELDSQLSTVENNLKTLFNKSQEILQETEANQKLFEEREKCIEKSEEELDYAHTKMQDVLENIFAAMDEINEFDLVKDSQVASQDVKEILKVKKEYHKLKKEYESLQMKMMECSYTKEVDERISECKCKITNLTDQVRLLQNEVKIGQEANLILKNNIVTLENELNCAYKKSEAHRRSYLTENMELNRKIIDLESAHISSENTTITSCGSQQLHFEGLPQSFKVLQEMIHQTRSGLQGLGNELKKLVCEASSHPCSSTTSLMAAIDMLEKYGTNVESCFTEMEKLRNALYSKDKLLEDKDTIITIQKDSILLTQNELKDLHTKLQEKIHAQDTIIAHLDKDNKQLQNKIELQVQTIGHLQNAVVQTKRCLDQAGQKSVSENERKNEAIHRLNIYLTETQHQYSECFAEAAKQDSLLEVQRDSIELLQQKIISKEYTEGLKIIILLCIYSANICSLQDELRIRTCDCENFKSQIDSLNVKNRLLEEKFLSTKVLWEKADFETICSIEEQKKLQQEFNLLIKENADLKAEIQKNKMDFEIMEQELKRLSEECLCIQNLKSELEKCSSEAKEFKLELEAENEDLKLELKKCKVEFDIVEEELKKQREECIPTLKLELEKLNSEVEDLNMEIEEGKKLIAELKGTSILTEEMRIKSEKQLVELNVNYREIKDLQEQASCCESVIAEETKIIEELKEKLLSSEQQNENCISELNNSKEMIYILKNLLSENSDSMAKLQADYQILKNDNEILKNENEFFESKAKEDIYELKSKLKENQIQLCIAEDNCKNVTWDFHKSQEHLLKTAEREAVLQKALTDTEEEFYSKMASVKKEEEELKDLINKMSEELEDTKEELSVKKFELEQIQATCNLYSSQLQNTQYDVQGLKENLLKLEEINCYLKKKLQECREENCSLLKQKKFAEQNYCKCINELKGMHNSLNGLRKECKMKSRSLACITAELTQASASRSELCNESQYVVSCIRDWMEEQKSIVETLDSKLKTQHQQLMHLSFEKKALQATVKNQRRIINTLMQKRKRFHKTSMCQSGRNICKCLSPIVGIGPNSSNPRVCKRCLFRPVKTVRKKSLHGNSWFFPRIEYIEKALRIENENFNKELASQYERDPGLDENRDCGYQSSASK